MKSPNGSPSLFMKIHRTKDPHPYQSDAVRVALAKWLDGLKVLLVAPTGSGKSFMGGLLMTPFIEQGHKCLFLAHARELVLQFAAGFQEDFGLIPTIEMGEHRADDSLVVCATVQTMLNRIASGVWKPDDYKVILFDESHRILSDSHLAVANYFKDHAHIGGLTASPRRGDMKDLLSFFDIMIDDIKLTKLWEDGYLARITIKEEPLGAVLNVGSKTGDVTDEEIDEALGPLLNEAADRTVKHHEGRCGLSFLPLRKTARVFAEKLRDRGLKAEYVGGDCTAAEQKKIKSMLKRGDIDHVSNAALWTEGVDVRCASLIADLRPTQSWPAAIQKWGRITRTFDPEANYAKRDPDYRVTKWGKKNDGLLLDFCFETSRHNMLQRPAVLIARDDEEAEAIQQKLRKGGGGDIMEAMNDVRSDREESLRKRLEAMAKRRGRLVDACEFFMKQGNLDMAEYEPMARWERDELTPGQRKVLIDNEIDLQTVKGKGHASALIDAICERGRKGLARASACKKAQEAGMVDAYVRPRADVFGYLSAIKQGGNPLSELDSMPF